MARTLLPFIDYLAIPSLDLSFGGEDAGSVYHSIYDDFYYYTHFSDTNFVYGRALAQTAGSAVLRMADAELLPYQYTAVAETIAGYVKELKTQLSKTQETIKERNLELDEGVFQAISDPEAAWVSPQAGRPIRRTSILRLWTTESPRSPAPPSATRRLLLLPRPMAWRWMMPRCKRSTIYCCWSNGPTCGKRACREGRGTRTRFTLLAPTRATG